MGATTPAGSTAASTVAATGHIGLNVTDLERSRDFYTEVLAFQVANESLDGDRRFAFLGDGEKLVLTLWQQADGRFSGASSGLHHLSFQVSSIEEIQQIEARLRKLGATIFHDGIVAHAEGAASGGIFFEDPDGIRLEVFAPDAGKGQPAPSNEAPTCGFF